jgi:hypothetical protein
MKLINSKTEPYCDYGYQNGRNAVKAILFDR